MNKEDYAPQEIRLASEIANALDDRSSLPLYLHFAHIYEEEDLRKLLERVLSVPDDKIKKTRGALFTYLVAYYEQKNTRD